MRGLRARRRRPRLLLALVAMLGVIASVVPIWDAMLAAHPLDRGRALPVGRSLQASHDLSVRRGSLPHLDLVAAAPAPAHLPHPPLVDGHRLDDGGAPGGHPSAAGSPDLSRSPPAC